MKVMGWPNLFKIYRTIAILFLISANQGKTQNEGELSDRLVYPKTFTKSGFAKQLS